MRLLTSTLLGLASLLPGVVGGASAADVGGASAARARGPMSDCDWRQPVPDDGVLRIRALPPPPPAIGSL